MRAGEPVARILYFADIRFPLERANGIQTMETCYALGTRGHRVELIVRPDTHVPPRDPFAYYGLDAARGALTIEHVPVTGPAAARRFGYLAFALGRAAGRSRADVVITRDLGVASLLLRIPQSLRPPLIYESHGYAPEVAAALPALLSTAAPTAPRKIARLARRESRVWHGAEGYVTMTEGLARDLTERHGSRAALAVVPDGVRSPGSGVGGPGTALRAPGSGIRDPGSDRTPDPGPRTPDPGTLFTVAYAGHLYPWKGVDVLIEALALVPEAQGLIIGGHAAEPDLSRVQTLAARLGIAERVTFTGLVEPWRVPDLLQTAAVLALPNPASAISTRATSPLKLFEYMAAGRPIVASDLPAIREVLHDGVDALLVRPGDPRAMADALRRLQQDPSLGSRLARAALDAVSRYSWDRRAERLDALLVEVIGVT
jgi:glycosyltransferase involved in cell wall biosynthesis